MRAVVALLLASALAGAAARAEAPAGVPPPPPLLLPPEDPAAIEPPPVDPADPSPPPEVRAPPPAPDAKKGPVVVQRPSGDASIQGAVAGAAGGLFGATLGAAALVTGALFPGTPPVLLLLLAPTLPALSSFFAGAAVLAFAVDKPTADDWGTVAGCAAIGCIGLAVIVGGVGGLGVGTSCGSCSNPCAWPGSSSSSSGNPDVIWSTAAAGLGSAIGLGVGAAIGFLAGASTGDALPLLLGGAAGSAIGGGVGGAIGGGVVGAGQTGRPTTVEIRP
jgi:hypothetical protein